MKTIIVNSPKYGRKKILVDDDMYDFLNEFTWCAQKIGHHFYAIRKEKRVISVLMHRVVLGITNTKVIVDHKDGNALNNQRENLRIATRSQNLYNRGSVINSTSRFKGVSWVKSHKLWKSSINYNKKTYQLGYFRNEAQAAIAYDAAAKIHHGEFANLNFK